MTWILFDDDSSVYIDGHNGIIKERLESKFGYLIIEIKEWDAISVKRWVRHASSGSPGMSRYPVWDDSIHMPSGKVTDICWLATCLLHNLVCTLM